MSSKVRPGHLKKVIALCEGYGFIHNCETTVGNKCPLSYGPLGSELRRNLINSWWRDVVTQQGFVVGVESPFTDDVLCTTGPADDRRPDVTNEGTEDRDNELQFSTSLEMDSTAALADLLPHFEKSLSLSERGLPIGLAQVGHRRGNGSFYPERYIFQPFMYTYFNLCFFCAPKDSSRWQNMWQRSRLQWWKKFSWTPSMFTSTDFKTEGSKQVIEIKYPFPWGEDVIERLINYGSIPEIKGSNGSSQKVKDGRKYVVPHLIQSVSCLEGGMLAYLLEAYQDANVPTQKGKKKRQFMRLHGKLCPVKVAIVGMLASDQIQEVSDLLAKDFRSVDFNVIQVTQDKVPSQTFDRLDKMGIPHSVLISEDTARSGMVKIRNRDTTLLQEINITKVMEAIQHEIKK